MKNRKLLLIVSLVLALTMSLGGTLAYLTDTDADVNVMTLGKVTIVQNEQRRVEADGEFTSVLEPFANDKTLLPYTERKGTADKITVGDYEIEIGDSYNNYIDKIVSVTNTGNSDAWVRTLVALPTGEAGDNHWHEYDAAADVWLHWNLCKEVYTHWDLKELTGGDFYITVNGVEYEVWQFTHKAPLAAGKTTYPSIRGLFMDKRVDMNEDGYYLTDNSGAKWPIKNITDKNGKVNVLVVSQAVQADGFATADAALTAGFPYGADNVNVQKWFTDLFDENGDVIEDMIGSPSDDGKNDKNDTNNPPFQGDAWDGTTDTTWFNAEQSEFVLTTAEQFAGVNELGEQLAGKTIKLGADIDLKGHEWTPINIFTPEKKITYDGQGHTIYNMTISSGSDVGLFGNTVATIMNFKVDGATVKSSGRSAIISAKNYGNIENCHVMNSTVEDSYWASGIIAGLYNAGDIKNCTVTNSSIKSNGGTSAIVGVLNETSGTRTIENCHVYNTTINNVGSYGEAYAGGGIIGLVNISNSTVNITGCSVDAKLEGQHIAEIYGYSDADNTINIQ